MAGKSKTKKISDQMVADVVSKGVANLYKEKERRANAKQEVKDKRKRFGKFRTTSTPGSGIQFTNVMNRKTSSPRKKDLKKKLSTMLKFDNSKLNG